MYEELSSLLREAFDAGIVTSAMQTRIDAARTECGITVSDYRVLESGIRVDAYLRKVQERQRLGHSFLGDLRKQYRITEEDAPVLRQKLQELDQPKPVASSSPSSPVASALERSERLKAETAGAAPTVPPAERPAPRPVVTLDPDHHRPLIIVADDNETQLFLTRATLVEHNYDCLTVETPDAAERLILEKTPALVICDINFGIGVPTGLDIFMNVRAKGYRMPFVIMSAFLQKEFKESAKRIGVSDYVVKPTDPDELIAVVKKHLR